MKFVVFDVFVLSIDVVSASRRLNISFCIYELIGKKKVCATFFETIIF